MNNAKRGLKIPYPWNLQTPEALEIIRLFALSSPVRYSKMVLSEVLKNGP